MRTFDFIVIGAGIAGASAAYELQARGRTLLLEREPLPGQHTTGRSAAFLVESYGNRVVQSLTRGGRDFLEDPPDGFAAHPILEPRAVLWIARPDQAERLLGDMVRAVAAGAELEQADLIQAHDMCPVLRTGYASAAVVEPRARHIDVAGLLDAYLRSFRARGGTLETRADVSELRSHNGGWEVCAGEDRFQTGIVVNAAGAWAEQIGHLAGASPIGLVPMRRTAITFDPPAGAEIDRWPCLIDADEDFYLKPEGAQLLASPCDETPFPPCDVSPDDLEVALAAERVMTATTLELRHIRRRWAGLRSFVADRAPVIGAAPECSGFFWLAGQGGSGIMTSSSAARSVASLVVDGALPTDLQRLGLSAEDLSPARDGIGSRNSEVQA
jgi:D-arginine dehydrogenase